MRELGQIVFLVDVRCLRFTFHSNAIYDRQINSIRFLCLQLINFFISKYSRPEFVRWGYKFYDSYNARRTFQRIDFKEFTSASEFEAFESQLIDRLTEGRNQPKKSHNGDLIQCLEKEITPEIHRSESPQIVSLTKALKEVLSDFQWDRPDLTSPERFKRKQKLNSTFANHQNYVFLISHCPKSDKELDDFIGIPTIAIEKTKIVLNHFMSNAVFQEYKFKKKLQLFWLDTDDKLHITNNVGYNKIVDVLSLLSGIVIPIDNVYSSVIPSSCIFSSYFQSSPISRSFYSLALTFKDKYENENILCNIILEPVLNIKDDTVCDTSNNLLILGMTDASFFLGNNQISYSVRSSLRDNDYIFSYILQNLLEKKLILIVCFEDKMGLLYPLTRNSSVLSILTSSDQLIVLQNEQSVPAKSTVIDNQKKHLSSIKSTDNNITPNLLSYVQSLTSRIQSGIVNSRFPNNLEDRENVSNVYDALPFITQVTEKWFVPEVTTDSIENLFKQQKNFEKEEIGLLKDLGEYYKISSSLQVVMKKEKIEDDDSENSLKSEKSPKKNCENLDISDEAKLVNSLKSLYNDTLEGQGCLISCAENIVKTLVRAKQYITKNELTEITFVMRILGKELMKSPQIMFNSYETDVSEKNKLYYSRECELQILLRLTVLNLTCYTDINEKFVHEIANFLMKLSIYLEPTYVSSFLKNTALTRYSNIPQKFFKQIYEILCVPFPFEEDESDYEDEKIAFLSMSSVGLESQTDISSPSSGISSLGHPPKHKLLRHYSFEVPQKRQISVQPFKKCNSFQQKVIKDIQQQNAAPDKKNSQKGGTVTKKVCRNLFNCDEIEQTCFSDAFKTPPKKKLVLKTKTVRCTPENKQVANATLFRQARRRGKSLNLDPRWIIQETPEKVISVENRYFTNSTIQNLSFYTTSDYLQKTNDNNGNISDTDESNKTESIFDECQQKDTVVNDTVMSNKKNIFLNKTPKKRKALCRTDSWPPSSKKQHFHSDVKCKMEKKLFSPTLLNMNKETLQVDKRNEDMDSEEFVPSSPFINGCLSPLPLTNESLTGNLQHINKIGQQEDEFANIISHSDFSIYSDDFADEDLHYSPVIETIIRTLGESSNELDTNCNIENEGKNSDFSVINNSIGLSENIESCKKRTEIQENEGSQSSDALEILLPSSIVEKQKEFTGANSESFATLQDSFRTPIKIGTPLNPVIIQRFTRKLSRDIGLSPDVLKELCTLSPEKSVHTKKTSSIALEKEIAQKPVCLTPSSPVFDKRHYISQPFSPSTDCSILHLTNSPIVSSVNGKIRSKKSKRIRGEKVKLVM